jgi:hypothetical protein
MKTILLAIILSLAICNGFAQKVFQAESAKEAQLKVYPAEDPDDADLWVCFVWSEKEITRTGLWMDMRFAHEADIIICFVDDEKDADLKIWLVDSSSESKWINQDKKKLLSLKKPAK